MKAIKNLILAGACLSFIGCGTIMDGSQQDVKIDSYPSGANIFKVTKDKEGGIVNRAQIGVTPATISISRKEAVILIEKEGFQSAEVPLKSSMNSWMWGNILLTSPLSTSIDTSTGASNEYDPGEYTVELIEE